MQLLNETIFHNWKVKRIIGAGNFGTVYEIEREEFGRIYRAAAKVISIPKEPGEVQELLREGMTEENVKTYYRSMVEKIISECELMERLKGDSHIVSYEDHYVEEMENGMRWTIYIRMELLKPLVSYITDGENILEEKEVVKLGMDICRGLESCQKFNVVHRDIKLENIFVSDTGHYKLGDFGISKVMKQRIDRTVVPKGTRLYMAPEILNGGKYDATVDIYSLGLVLFRLMNNNRAPFLPSYPETICVKDKERALRRRLGGEEIPKPCNADEHFGAVIQKACSFRPENRYRTPGDMRRDLAELWENREFFSENSRAGVFSPDKSMETENASATFCVHKEIGVHNLIMKKEIRKRTRIYRNRHKNFGGRGVAVFLVLAVTGCFWLLEDFRGLLPGENSQSIARFFKDWEGSAALYMEKGAVLNRSGKVYHEDSGAGFMCFQIVKREKTLIEQGIKEHWLEVPWVCGLAEKEAIATLTRSGFDIDNIEISYEYNGDVEAGDVIIQSIEKDLEDFKTSRIAISVSLGDKPKPPVAKKSTKEEEDSGWTWKAID